MLLFLGNDYYSRRLLSFYGFSIFDVIYVGYILYFMLFTFIINKQKMESIKISKYYFLLLIALLTDFLIGIYNRNDYVLSDFRLVLQFVFFYLYISFYYKDLVENSKAKRLMYLAAITGSMIYIMMNVFPHGAVYNFYNSRIGLKDDIVGQGDIILRIFGPLSIALWVPVIAYRIQEGKIFKINVFAEAFLWLMAAYSIFVSGSRQILIMFFLSLILSTVIKIGYHHNFKLKFLSYYFLVIVAFCLFMGLHFYNNDRYLKLFTPMNDTSFKYRLYTNTAVVEKIKERPIIGSGLGATYMFQLYNGSPILKLNIADNAWLTLFYKTNILTSIIIVTFFIQLIVKAYRTSKADFTILLALLFSSLLSAHIFTKLEYAFILMFIYSKNKSIEIKKGGIYEEKMPVPYT